MSLIPDNLIIHELFVLGYSTQYSPNAAGPRQTQAFSAYPETQASAHSSSSKLRFINVGYGITGRWYSTPERGSTDRAQRRSRDLPGASSIRKTHLHRKITSLGTKSKGSMNLFQLPGLISNEKARLLGLLQVPPSRHHATCVFNRVGEQKPIRQTSLFIGQY